MSTYEEECPEKSMSLMVDRPVPIANTEYAYYIGELLPLTVAIYVWMQVNNRWIVAQARIREVYNDLSLSRKLQAITERRYQMGLTSYDEVPNRKTDEELVADLLVVLEN
jgi:hypothetical protein